MENTSEIRSWWESKRFQYNKGLVVAGITAFLTYAILGSILIAPYDQEFEITHFTIVFQGIGYLVMIAIANFLYLLGPFVDANFNRANNQQFRERLYLLGYWFSIALPFLIPLMVVIIYFVRYA
jgi:hypothetical protein